MLTTIKLRGSLGKEFTSKVNLHVSSVGEAIRALCANFPGFKKYMLEGDKKFHVRSNTVGALSGAEINLSSDVLSEIELIPVIQGSGDVGKIIVAAILIYVSYQLGFDITAAAGANSALSTAVFSMGVQLAISGVMGLLFSPPEPEYTDPGNTASYNFNGAINTVAQGHPVPVGYGRVIVGSAIIGAGIHTRNR